ncbi:MAG: Ger(x)C family spore germination protein [Oscillospiraceae bacterium]|jgi:spore germination protein KC|nr:Ger(x)C family spore germination protein [Oscillospiraceae bacterium]
MRKLRFAVAILLVCATLSGCSGEPLLPMMNEIDDFDIIQVLGIDRSAESPDEVEVTIIAGKGAGGGGESAGTERMLEIESATAPTVIGALSNLNLYSDRRHHLGYTDFLLIGESAAADDISKYTDYFTRYHETRYSTRVFIIRGTSAHDFLKSTVSDAHFVADALGNFDETVRRVGNTGIVSVIDMINMLDAPDSATVLPALKTRDVDDTMIIGGEMPEKDFAPAGYAVLRDFKLAGYFEPEYSLGYNALTGKMHTAPLNVKDPDGFMTGVIVMSDSLNLTPVWDGDKLKSVTIESVLSANVGEQHGRNDIYHDAPLAELCDTISADVKSRMEKAVERARELGVDSLDLAERIRTKNPVKWKRIEGNWRELFAQLPINVKVTTCIRRPYDLREPNGFKPQQAADKAKTAKEKHNG